MRKAVIRNKKYSVMQTNIGQNRQLDLEKLKEYLLYLEGELTKYEEDWEITKNEFQAFKVEYKRFQELVKSSNKIPDKIKGSISELTFKGKTNTNKLIGLLRYIYLWDAAAYRLNQLDDKEIIENMRAEIDRIKYQVILIGNNNL